MSDVNWSGLRKPFPKEQITQVNKGFGPIDTINHAVVTSRLNADAGDWSFTIDDTFTHGNAFWIRGTLTIGGVSRPEFGEGQDPKKALSDFLKRASMRFGVALDLWAKAPLDDQEDVDAAPKVASTVAGDDGPEPSEGLGEGPQDVEGPRPPAAISIETKAALTATYGSAAKAKAAAQAAFGDDLGSIRDLTEDQGRELLNAKVAVA